MQKSFSINLNTHLINEVKFINSPNYDKRPDETDISLIVIHGISLPPNVFGGKGVEQLFCNRLDPNEDLYYQQIYQLKVSAHLYIKRTGQVIQFVAFNNRAWHAGKSQFKGQSACNDFSIGIELEGADNIAYEENQYQALNKILPILQKAYPKILTKNIVGHSYIAPGRKTDPGNSFNWQKINQSSIVKKSISLKRDFHGELNYKDL